MIAFLERDYSLVKIVLSLVIHYEGPIVSDICFLTVVSQGQTHHCLFYTLMSSPIKKYRSERSGEKIGNRFKLIECFSSDVYAGTFESTIS